MTDTAAIHVGADPEAINAARVAILDILKTDREEATIRQALSVFSQVCAVHHVTISGGTFHVGSPAPGVTDMGRMSAIEIDPLHPISKDHIPESMEPFVVEGDRRQTERFTGGGSEDDGEEE